MRSHPLLYKSLIITVFFLSGVCGLIYEVLWTRYLASLVGATALSQVIVLTVFMGGLSIGALWFGRLVDRGKNGLICYGYLEAGIGLYAIIFPFLFHRLEFVFHVITSGMEPGTFPLLLTKILLAVLLITLPSVLMGGTLPVLTKYLTSSRILLRRNISLLYGLNSMGAVLGVLLGGFYFVHTIGMSASIITTGIGNLSLGLAALLGACFVKKYGIDLSLEKGGTSLLRRSGENHDKEDYRPFAVRRAIIAAGISGLAAMALQVAWIRYFVIILGATHSAFTIVVAAFIFGISLGALLVSSRFIGRISLPALLTVSFALNALTLGIGLFFYDKIPFFIGYALAIFARIPQAWLPYEFTKFAVCFLLMLIPCLASGMVLPTCVRIAGRSDERIGRDVAVVYATNTLGSIVGVILTGQILFRITPLPITLQFIMFIYAGAALYLAFVLEEKGRKRIFAVLVVLIIGHLTAWKPWKPHYLYVSHLAFGQDQSITYEKFKFDRKRVVVVDDRQGPDVKVSVLDSFGTTRPFRTLYINGKPDASNDPTGPDLMTQILLARLPLLLHPDPDKVFILGLGSGITSGEAVQHPSVKEVVTVELAREVYEASIHFSNDNNKFWENPKHRIVIDDGKTFLNLTNEKYDVIVLEPTNIWQEGMAGLFSADFFKMAKSSLSPDGLMAQWLHTYRVDNRTLNIVLKTFATVFPGASIFEMGRGDILLIGYGEKWHFNPIKIEHDFYRPHILDSMKKIGINSPAELLLREAVSPKGFDIYTSTLKSPVNTDNLPVLEQAAEYGLFMGQSATALQGTDSRLDVDEDGLLIQEYIRRLGLDVSQVRKLAGSGLMKTNQRIRNSMALKIITSRHDTSKSLSPKSSDLSLLEDPLLREVVTHPSYRGNPFLMSPQEAYRLIGGELLIWSRASSVVWKPDVQRLKELYYRLAPPGDEPEGGELALRIALPLAEEGACSASIPFLRIASEKGFMTPDNIDAGQVTDIFHCEVKAGELHLANMWWQILNDKYPDYIDERVLRDKTLLDREIAIEEQKK